MRYITLVAPVDTSQLSRLVVDPDTHDQPRDHLRWAPMDASRHSALTKQQELDVPQVCCKYPYLLSRTSKDEFDRCTTKSDVSLGTRDQLHQPYIMLSAQRVECVIGRCAEQLVEDGIMKKRSRQWSSPVTLLTKFDDSPSFCVDYRNTINAHLEGESWVMISSN